MASISEEQKRANAHDLKDIETIPQALRYFVTCGGPLTMMLFLVVALAAKFAIYPSVGWADLAVVGGIILIWWFQEWFLHVTVLHMKPLKVGGMTIDPGFARVHREHHAKPWHDVLVFVPTPYVILGFIVASAIFYLVLPTPLALTALAAYCVMGVLYEWTHYLVHTRYKPKSKFFKELWRNHRLHHFKNENYWYGLSVTWVDGVLGTAPDHSQVEKSETVRMQHLEEN